MHGGRLYLGANRGLYYTANPFETGEMRPELQLMPDVRIKRKENRLRRAQQRAMELKEKEFQIETEQREQEIIRLKNEQLEAEISHKTNELVNSAILLGRKNETLQEIKSDLLKILHKQKDGETDNLLCSLLNLMPCRYPTARCAPTSR